MQARQTWCIDTIRYNDYIGYSGQVQAGIVQARTQNSPILKLLPRAAPDKVGDKVGYEVRSTNFRKNAEIVVYCGGPNCPQSRMAL